LLLHISAWLTHLGELFGTRKMNEFAGQLQRGVLSSAENTLQSPVSQSAFVLQGSPDVHLRLAVAPQAVVAALTPLLPVLLLLLLVVVVMLLPAGTLPVPLLLPLTSSDASTQVLPLGSGTCCLA
jgi:hypothetical protein